MRRENFELPAGHGAAEYELPLEQAVEKQSQYEQYEPQLREELSKIDNSKAETWANKLMQLALNHHAVVEWARQDSMLREMYEYNKAEAKFFDTRAKERMAKYVVCRDGDAVLEDLLRQKFSFLNGSSQEDLDNRFNMYLQNAYDNLEAVEVILKNKIADLGGPVTPASSIERPTIAFSYKPVAATRPYVHPKVVDSPLVLADTTPPRQGERAVLPEDETSEHNINPIELN